MADSDDSTSYVNLKDIVKEHHPQVIPKKEIGRVLPWVHIAISNAKEAVVGHPPRDKPRVSAKLSE